MFTVLFTKSMFIVHTLRQFLVSVLQPLQQASLRGLASSSGAAGLSVDSGSTSHANSKGFLCPT